MMAVPAVKTAATLVPHHASPEEYGTFLQTYIRDERTMKFFLGTRARFVRKYPDLRDWFQAPLVERVGRLYGELPGQRTNPISYKARGYLCFLALRGYAQFDWE